MPEPSTIRIALPNVALSALDYGRPSADAPVLLLLHGMADLAWSMDAVARGLRHRYHAIALDLRGHGGSDHPGAYSIMHYAADLIGVIGAVGADRPILLGHSLGGQVVTHVAGMFPELARAVVAVEGLGPPVRFATDEVSQRVAMGRARVEMLAAPARHRPLADVAAAAARLCAVHVGLDPDRARFLAERATTPAPDGGVVWRFDPRTRDWLAMSDWSATEDRWRSVRCPVLAVTGALAWERWWEPLSWASTSEGWAGRDPAENARRVALFPDAEHVELADGGHMLPIEVPDELVGVVGGFLGRRVAA